MFMKNDKKKIRPIFAMGLGAMAVYGAYSMVSSIKNTCCEKAQMLTNVLKNKSKKKNDCTENCEDNNEN